MRRTGLIMTIIAALLLVSRLASAAETPAARQYAALLAEYEQEGGARLFAKRFLTLGKDNIQDPVAADALLWVVENARGRREAAEAIELLARHHADSPKLGPACQLLAGARTVGTEKLLRLVLEKHPDNHARAAACFYLAALLDREAVIVDQLRANPELAPRVLQYYGQEYGDHLASLDPAALAKQREMAYARLLEAFPDVEIEGQPAGKVAASALWAIRHLSVGQVVVVMMLLWHAVLE